jgi:type II secretory ATPase GspE/PulE/Tfp pilus assembly ATPase PilB-like protein
MMRRQMLGLSLLAAFVVAIAHVDLARAQAASDTTATADAEDVAKVWPPVELAPSGQGDIHTFVRGPGWNLGYLKITFAWLLILLWICTTDWINRDCQTLRLNYMQWNSIAVFPFFFAVVLLWILPFFIVGLLLMMLAYGGSVGAYVYFRNQKVEDHQRVLTPEHLRYLASAKFGKMGVKIDAQKKAAHEGGAPVDFVAKGGATDRDNAANLLLARQMPGFVPAKDLIAEAIRARSEVIMLDYTAEAVAVRHQIDGVWHAAPSRDRESGDGLLGVLKQLAALDPAQRAARQIGTLQATLDGRKFLCRLVSQGTESGERVVVKLDDGSASFHHYAELGVREKVAEQFQAVIDGEPGFVLLSAMPAGGLSALLQVTLEECDRLMRGFVALEDEKLTELNLENVEVKTYQAAAGQTPLTILPEVLKSYPEVLVVPTLPDAATVAALCEQVSEESRAVIATIRAKEAPEALLRVLMLKVPAATFAPTVRAVMNVRLVRKLCEKCKVAFEPTPDLLQKLGIPAGRVPHLFREPTAEERQTPCETCRGIGYFGRTGLFELLVVDDKVREVLIKQPKLDLLKKVARAAGMRNLQEEGILLVAKGVTSVPELMRVLKQ